MHNRSRIARLLAAVAAAVGLIFGGLAAAAPAHAAESITITPATITAASNVLSTYTLAYSCSTTGGCLDSTVTIPTDTVTDNGANTDFSNWVGAGTCPTLTRAPGQVTFALGNVATGTYSCNFTVRPPNKTTLNGARATITPTFTSSGGSAVAPTPAVLTVTAGRNVGMGAGVNPTNVLSGASMVLSFTLLCGSSQTAPAGDLGLTALQISDALPNNFTFTSVSTAPASLPGSLTTPAVGATGGTITYVGDGSECLNPANNRIVFTVQGTATTDGAPTPVGARICHTPSATFTYIDGFAASAAPTPASPCATVVDLDWRTGKSAAPKTMFNRGQYVAIDGSVPTLYTFPGDWDGASSTTYEITVNTDPATTNSGLSYDIKDPLPCLDNVSGPRYQSNAPGVVCANPAYIPRTITVTGFTPVAGATINLLMADGTTRTVPYMAGAGWTLPTSPAVSQIDIPPFAQEGSNNFAVIRFRVNGYASPAAAPGYILANTTTVNAFLAGTATQVKTSLGQTANVLVADPEAYGDNALVYADLTTTYSGSCVARVQPQGSGIEITEGPSRAIYLSYLAPEGVDSIAIPPLTATLAGSNGRVYTANGISPTNQITDYDGTGRTLVNWTIPAGTAAEAGLYTVGLTGFDVPLGAGCAGTFDNALTIGYGAPIAYCAVDGVNVAPPAPAAGDPALDTNGSPIAGSYCGASAPLRVTATNPGFTVDKVVQGNLDPAPIGAGGTGHVSVDGGSATYTLSFSNTGQSTLADPVMYDILPRVGDTRASAPTPRGSQFAVALTSIGELPENLTVAYSLATNPCRPEVLPSNSGCVSDWTTTAPSSLNLVTALRFTYDGNVRVGDGFTAEYAVSTPATAAGSIAWNSVGTNVIAGDALLGAAESSLTGLQADSAQPAITKAVDRATFDAVGQPIVFTFTVTNNTAVTLTNVRVTDALVDSAPSSIAPTPTCSSLADPAGTCSGASVSLQPGQSAVFTATYETTQADLDHGSLSDQATATAEPPSGPALRNSSDVVAVTALQQGALTLTKTAGPTSVDSVGDVISYTFTVRNTGNVTLRNLAINETAFSGSGALSAITCPSGSLAPDATIQCTATYPVTQADLTAGAVQNSATASAITPEGGSVTSPESSATVPVEQTASLDLVKSATPAGADSYNAGQLITYTFVVTNTGNVPVTDISVDEVDFTGSGDLSPIDCPTAELHPTEQVTCTATYTLTQADVDSRALTNTARAVGTAPGGPVTSDDASVTTPQTPLASLALSKTSDTAFVNAAGETVTYSFAVRNAGNVTIADIAIEETDFTGSGDLSAVSCPVGTLAPGQQLVCTAEYTITQADMNEGSVENTAVATGLDPADADVVSAESTATITANAAPALTIEKSADVESFDTAGDDVVFSFLVTNTGNVALTDVVVAETSFTGAGTLGAMECPSNELAPGDTLTCTAAYEVTQADIDAGGLENTAESSAQSPSGGEVLAERSTVSVDAVQRPALALEKTATPGQADAAGDVITYSFRVSNEGNVTVNTLEIVESEFTGAGALAPAECAETTLAPGDEVTCEIEYSLLQADVDAGQVVNMAIATADAAGAETSTEASTATVTIDRTPGLSLVKSAELTEPDDIRAGDVVTYSFVVTNTGNVTITDAAVDEEAFTGTGNLGEPVCEHSEPLAPTDQLVCAVEYTLTQADVDAGEISNTAVAVGEAPDGLEPPSSPASSVTVPEPADPRLSLVKSTDVTKITAAGQTVTYSFTITNTGNTTARGVGVREESFSGQGRAVAVACAGETTLLPGQIIVCTADYIVVAADLDGTALRNTATATGESPDGSGIVSDASTAVIDDVVTSASDGDLAGTGGMVAWGAAAIAVGLVACGMVLLLVRRRRSEA
ncbi:DUF11 domain-containing protein [Microbacterium sp. CPCC 204701]|uniref:DUF11 domain-containing protein n=1 Tax=Microbacterium sp. CPCC 204701 TaxID=2493084 RepID=UPI001F0C476F|nr:DUF11 domain-containing protein [Microbacterium sp. CPCC 204701]